MGVDRDVYIGPYVCTTTEVIEKQFDRCGHEPADSTKKHCPECGEFLPDRYFTENVEIVDYSCEDDSLHGIFL